MKFFLPLSAFFIMMITWVPLSAMHLPATSILYEKNMRNVDRKLFTAQNSQDVQEALQEGADVHAQDFAGRTALLYWLMFRTGNSQYSIDADELKKMFLIMFQHGASVTPWHSHKSFKSVDDYIALILLLQETYQYYISKNKLEYVSSLPRINYDHYLPIALDNGDGHVVSFILEKKQQSPMSAILVLLATSNLSKVLLPYLLLCSERSDLRELYQYAQESNNKLLGRELIDYHIATKLYGGDKLAYGTLLAPELVAEILSYVGKLPVKKRAKAEVEEAGVEQEVAEFKTEKQLAT